MTRRDLYTETDPLPKPQPADELEAEIQKILDKLSRDLAAWLAETKATC